jgi:hypothetical protein
VRERLRVGFPQSGKSHRTDNGVARVNQPQAAREIWVVSLRALKRRDRDEEHEQLSLFPARARVVALESLLRRLQQHWGSRA